MLRISTQMPSLGWSLILLEAGSVAWGDPQLSSLFEDGLSWKRPAWLKVPFSWGPVFLGLTSASILRPAALPQFGTHLTGISDLEWSCQRHLLALHHSFQVPLFQVLLPSPHFRRCYSLQHPLIHLHPTDSHSRLGSSRPQWDKVLPGT